jgi:glycosyltransferase involved in cell wall biosynthesis
MTDHRPPTDSQTPTDTVGESPGGDEPSPDDVSAGAVGDDRSDSAGSPDDDTPTVSVVIPTHFRNDRLRAALDSVAGQTYPAIETVVVDDSGERHAESVVADFDAQYVAFDENRGSNAARSAGVAATSGEFVQLLDDDDRLHPEKLARQVAVLDSRPEAGVVYCGMRFEDGRVVTPDAEARGEVLDRALAFALYPCQTTTMLLRRSALSTVFPAESRPGGDDLAYMIELARRTEFDFVADPLVVRGSGDRSRGSSLGLVEGRMRLLDEYADLYDAAPDWVRRQALVGTYLFEGRTHLTDTLWSARSIAAFARAASLQRDAYTLGLCLASVAGKPGLAFGSAVFDWLSPGVSPPSGTYHGPKQA